MKLRSKTVKTILTTAFLIAILTGAASADGLVVGQDSYADVLRENGAKIEQGGALIVEPDRRYYPDIDAPDLEPGVPGDGLNFWLEGKLLDGIPDCADTDFEISALSGILGRRFYDNKDLGMPAAVAHAMVDHSWAFHSDPDLVAKLVPQAFQQSQTIVSFPVSSESTTEVKFYRSPTATIVAQCIADKRASGGHRCVSLVTTDLATYNMQLPALAFLKTNHLECIIGALAWLERETSMHIVK
jgi:hypothetical protein